MEAGEVVAVLWSRAALSPLTDLQFVRALFGSCLLQAPGLLQWQVLYREFPCALRSRTWYTAGICLFGRKPYFLLPNLS
jgi:hypothetical protein